MPDLRSKKGRFHHLVVVVVVVVVVVAVGHGRSNRESSHNSIADRPQQVCDRSRTPSLPLLRMLLVQMQHTTALACVESCRHHHSRTALRGTRAGTCCCCSQPVSQSLDDSQMQHAVISVPTIHPKLFVCVCECTHIHTHTHARTHARAHTHT